MTLAYPSVASSLVTHVSEETFIVALNDTKLQLEVMKGYHRSSVQAALSHAIKIEAFKQSLACQGTLAADTGGGQAERRPRNVYSVSDQKDASETTALHKRVDELQAALTQATKSIAALVVAWRADFQTTSSSSFEFEFELA